MIEIKIFCGCGSKYKFEIEPVNERLPGPVACPVCGADGTEQGNRILVEKLTLLATAASTGHPSAEPSPVHTEPTGQDGATSTRSGFISPAIPRSSKELKTSAGAASPHSPPISDNERATAMRVPGPAVPGSTPDAAGVASPGGTPVESTHFASGTIPVPKPVVSPPMAVQRVPVAVHPTAPESAKAGSESPSSTPEPAAAPRSPSPATGNGPFIRGLVGIGLASFVALIAWFLILLIFSKKLTWLAIGIGTMIGWSGAKLAKEKSVRLGIAAAVATVIVLVVGSLWAARYEAVLVTDTVLQESYDEVVEYAKEAVKASTDEELKAFLKENGYPPRIATPGDEKAEMEQMVKEISAMTGSISESDFRNFRTKDLPELRKFADGTVSRASYEYQNRPILEEYASMQMVIRRTLGISLLIWIGFAVGAAWRFCTR